MAKKRKIFDPFNISFLDCICCGFGAVILLFVIARGEQVEEQARTFQQLEAQTVQENLADHLALKESLEKELKKEKERLKATLASIDPLRKTLSRAEEEEAKEKEQPLPFPNPVQRQYLTDFKMNGERILILLEASGGMLDITADKALAQLKKPESQRNQSEKWQRVVRITEWILANLSPTGQYQMYTFNRKTQSILPALSGKWLDRKDDSTLVKVVKNLRQLQPQGGANFEQAALASRKLSPFPDNIILITDGLPTIGNTQPSGTVVSHAARMAMFNVAQRELPFGVPINIILLPMSGDPSAASLYWQLACRTNGSFICPASNWPEI